MLADRSLLERQAKIGSMIQTDPASRDPNLIVRKAELRDVLGISRVCSDGSRDTHASIHTPEHIERVIESIILIPVNSLRN